MLWAEWVVLVIGGSGVHYRGSGAHNRGFQCAHYKAING
jgi:hypothetical protein